MRIRLVLVKIVYRISEEDYMGARDLFIANERPLYRRISRRLMPWVGACVLAVEIIYVIVVPRRDPAFAVFGFAIGIYLVYCGFALRRYFRRSYQKDHRYKHDFTAEISDAGVHITTPFSEGQLKWNGFVRFLESDTIFMVFIAEWNFLIFPKRAFESVEADQFRSLLNSNIAPAK